MAKAHKDYTIADMLRLGGAWVKKYEDVDALRYIAGTLAMMDKATTLVTIEPFMREDKSIESDPSKIKAICLSLDGGTHVPTVPVNINAINKTAIKRQLTAMSKAMHEHDTNIRNLKERLNQCYASIRNDARLKSAVVDVTINPSEVCTFAYVDNIDANNAVFVQSVPTNLSRVDSDGNIHQRCMGRYVVVISFSASGSISCYVVASVDGISAGQYIHPNVGSSGSLCFGEGNAEAAILMAKSDVVGLLKLIDNTLRTSQYGIPYEHLVSFSESTRARVVTTSNEFRDHVERMVEPLATCIGPVVVSRSNRMKAIPCSDIAPLLKMEGTTVSIIDTDIPEVVYIEGQSTYSYAPRSMFKIATPTVVPSVGAWRYSTGAYAFNGVLYGNRDEYETPTRLDTYTVDSNTTAIVDGLLIVDDEVCIAVAKIVAGVTVGLFARTSVGLKRVGSVDKIAEFIPTRLAEELQESRYQRLVDTGIGLMLMNGDKQAVNVVNNERVTDVVEGTENMPAYSI